MRERLSEEEGRDCGILTATSARLESRDATDSGESRGSKTRAGTGKPRGGVVVRPLSTPLPHRALFHLPPAPPPPRVSSSSSI